MDWLTFTSSVIDAVISWPVALLVVVFLLLRPLKKLLWAIAEFRSLSVAAGGVQADVERKVEEIDQETDKAELPPPTTKPLLLPQEESAGYEWLYALAETEPRSAVIEAWSLIEIKSRSMAKKRGLDIRAEKSADVLMTVLLSEGAIGQTLHKILVDLHKVRTTAAEHSVDVSPETAVTYVRAALRVLNALSDE